MEGATCIRKSRSLTNVIVLIVATHKQRLAIRQVEIKLGGVRVVVCRSRRVESIAAGVDTVTDRRIVSDVATRLCLAR